jgi:hypothetical protein
MINAKKDSGDAGSQLRRNGSYGQERKDERQPDERSDRLGHSC